MRSWSVRRLLVSLLVASTLVALLVGLIGAFAVHETTETVDVVSQELGPAQNSNSRFMEAMLDAETELRAYTISGEQQQLSDYREAIRQSTPLGAVLRRYAAVHPQLDTLVEAQFADADAWVRDFAEQAVRRGGGPGTYDRDLYELGVQRFDAIKAVNRQITQRLQDEVASARAMAQDRLDSTVTLIIVVGILGALSSLLLGWWFTRSLRSQLSGIEATVDRLAAGDEEARAEVGGPAEISRLAAALNDLAEENARARAIEHRVQLQLMEVDRAKSEFVSNVSHELRTPLTIINGYLELLTDELADQVTETEAEMFDVTARNVTRLRLLIEDLLELNRTEGPTTPQLREVDLVTVLEDVVTDVGLSASSRSVSISLDTGGTPAVVRADPGQLHRAVLNLASNAVKFSRDGSEVRVRMVTMGDEVEVTIADDGIGIPTADQAKVGERFFRASNAVAGEVSGTGLGLRIVKSIVDNHHGTFGLQSVEGKGTTVRLRLPLHRPAADAPDREQVTV